MTDSRSVNRLAGGAARTAWFGLSALLITLAGLAVTLVGRPLTAQRWHCAIARRFSGTSTKPAAPGATRRTMLTQGLVVLPMAAGSLGVAAPALLTIYTGLLFPLRSDVFSTFDHPFTAQPVAYEDTWGGPTPVGAWGVHAGLAIVIVTFAGVVVWVSGWLHGKVTGLTSRRVTTTRSVRPDEQPDLPQW